MENILRNRILYKSGPGPADFCINHVKGCFHGCRFPCYAMLMKKRCGEIKNYEDWIKPKLVGNAMELLDNELPKLKGKIKTVHLCYSTDPFMQKQPEVGKMTLEIMERLNLENIKCVVLTKGILPACLADVKKYGKNNEYGITLVSLDKEFKKQFEPNSAPYSKRIKSLEYLYKKGLKTWVSMEAYPTSNMVKQDLGKILEKISFVNKIVFGKLNYNTKAAEFLGAEAFYEKQVKEIRDFCRGKGIECHIKYGTSKEYDKEMERVFGKERQMRKFAGVLPIPI